MKDKKEKRATFLKIRQHIPSKMKKSINIEEQLLPILLKHENIGVYASMSDEVDTTSLIKKLLEKGKKIYFPKLIGNTMQFYRVHSLNDLVVSKGKYKIKEPISNEAMDKNNLEVVVVPGVAFDLKGNRLGFGKGYYDWCLKDYKGYKIGICFKEQLMEEVPHNKHDIKMNIVIFDK